MPTEILQISKKFGLSNNAPAEQNNHALSKLLQYFCIPNLEVSSPLKEFPPKTGTSHLKCATHDIAFDEETGEWFFTDETQQILHTSNLFQLVHYLRKYACYPSK